jgi:hypothetical protein
MYPEEFYDAALHMAVRLNALIIGIESTSLEEFIKRPFIDRMVGKGLFFEVMWLKPRGGFTPDAKISRINALAPYYRAGLISHNPNCCEKLENQLLFHPRSKLWDVKDAFAYIIELLAIRNIALLPEEQSKKFSELPDEKEYIELEDLDEKPVTNWRVC